MFILCANNMWSVFGHCSHGQFCELLDFSVQLYWWVIKNLLLGVSSVCRMWEVKLAFDIQGWRYDTVGIQVITWVRYVSSKVLYFLYTLWWKTGSKAFRRVPNSRNRKNDDRIFCYVFQTSLLAWSFDWLIYLFIQSIPTYLTIARNFPYPTVPNNIWRWLILNVCSNLFSDDAQLATSTGIFAITLGVSVPIASNFNVTVEYYLCELHIFNLL